MCNLSSDRHSQKLIDSCWSWDRSEESPSPLSSHFKPPRKAHCLPLRVMCACGTRLRFIDAKDGSLAQTVTLRNADPLAPVISSDFATFKAGSRDADRPLIAALILKGHLRVHDISTGEEVRILN